MIESWLPSHGSPGSETLSYPQTLLFLPSSKATLGGTGTRRTCSGEKGVRWQMYLRRPWWEGSEGRHWGGPKLTGTATVGQGQLGGISPQSSPGNCDRSRGRPSWLLWGPESSACLHAGSRAGDTQSGTLSPDPNHHTPSLDSLSSFVTTVCLWGADMTSPVKHTLTSSPAIQAGLLRLSRVTAMNAFLFLYNSYYYLSLLATLRLWGPSEVI